MRQIAATRRRDRLLQQIATCDMWKSLLLRQNFVTVTWRMNSNWFQFVRRIAAPISASSLVTKCVHICNKSLRQNLNQPMRKHQLVSCHVKFKLVHISSLPKLLQAPNKFLIAATCCRISADEGTCRRNVSHRVSRPLLLLFHKHIWFMPTENPQF